ncbi:MAG: metallophosphoesterase [Saprospiraceae bacterium]|nr:metallophosphoesterase [Saprospiraceae bacterium]
MNRRELILSLATVSGGLGFKKDQKPVYMERQSSFAIDGNRVRFFHPDIKERFNVIMLADTHLFRDDERGDAFKEYSGRMAKAYNQTKHFLTKESTNPEESFEKTLAIAQKEEAKLVALIGDILSFPSEAAVDWVSECLKKANLPYLYVAGNHDWHYEGMAGSIAFLRETWIQKRLLPLYQTDNPMMTVREINGVRLVALDNSNYQITSEQLAFFQKEVATKKPLVLMVHIPFYAPERSVGFGCGHPDWGAKTDKNYQLERRERWSETGHTNTTMTFYKEVINAPNLLGVLAGHIHEQSLDVLNGLPQIVTYANAHGAYLKVEFVPNKK